MRFSSSVSFLWLHNRRPSSPAEGNSTQAADSERRSEFHLLEVGRASTPDKASIGIIFLSPSQIVQVARMAQVLGNENTVVPRSSACEKASFSRVIRQDKSGLPSNTAEVLKWRNWSCSIQTVDGELVRLSFEIQELPDIIRAVSYTNLTLPTNREV